MVQLKNYKKGNGRRRQVIDRIVKWINYGVLIISIMMLVIGTLSNITHRLIGISYVASEIGVPYKLKMHGTIYALDKDGESVVMLNPSVAVGGFYTDANSNGQYELSFVSASNKRKVPVRISFCDTSGKEYVFYEEVEFDGEYKLVKDFNLNVGY